jgi:chromate transporter
MNQTVSLYQLFWTFLRIGATSFGGYMALVAVVQKQMVERQKRLTDEQLMEGITLSSMMPGPLAVNTVTYLGYQLRGWAGALVSMFAVLLPSFVLVVILADLYFRFQELPFLETLFQGVLPAVMAIILSVAYKMFQKHIHLPWQWLVVAAAFVAMVLLRGFYVAIALIIVGGIIGYVVDKRPAKLTKDKIPFPWRSMLKEDVWHLGLYFLLPLTLISILLTLPVWWDWTFAAAWLDGRHLLLTFSGMSVTLFGGGYVFIPAIQEVVVTDWGWLTAQEFADGVAVGQITPGPIMITATFIGYKVWGLMGAILATIGMYLPTGVLMVFVGRYFNLLKGLPAIQSAFKGIRPVVIGMIAASVIVIGRSVEIDFISVGIFLLTLFLAIRMKISALYLIPLGGFLVLLVNWLM